jgi:hypothetical protein
MVWCLDTGKEEVDPDVLAEKVRLSDVYRAQGAIASSTPLSRCQAYPLTLGYAGGFVVDVLLSKNSAAPPMLLRGRADKQAEHGGAGDREEEE